MSTSRAKGRSVVSRDGLLVAYVAGTQESPTMLDGMDVMNPDGAPHRYADLCELRPGEEIWKRERWDILTESFDHAREALRLERDEARQELIDARAELAKREQWISRHVTEDHRLMEAATELRRIDMLLERRPALDKPTRYENIAHAIQTAKTATEELSRLKHGWVDGVVSGGVNGDLRVYVSGSQFGHGVRVLVRRADGRQPPKG